uniref:RluA family pseudouridine synthase n=1 Tax=Roseihalotalea indica TaxID=2867963 RepID=A0AA49GPZ5_9BACT|nr:RluA family pseudouridine synthase [Tunicatimonas sp. TK19036]
MSKIQFKDLILYEDEDYIIINKPSHVATLEDRNDPYSIIEMAREYLADAQVGHRLDKETTGALALAKHPDAYRALALQFEHRRVKKVYHAVCDGIHNFQNVEIDLPIYSNSRGTVRISHREGKPAQTLVNTLEAYKLHTLVQCQPVTGRTHQIRVHLASLKAPIAGDEQYGGAPFYLSSIKRRYNLKKDTEELPLIRRVALHAQALEIELLKGERVCIEAPYPKDFAVLVKQLAKNRY